MIDFDLNAFAVANSSQPQGRNEFLLSAPLAKGYAKDLATARNFVISELVRDAAKARDFVPFSAAEIQAEISSLLEYFGATDLIGGPECKRRFWVRLAW